MQDLFCGECRHLSPTEEEQNKMSLRTIEPHICTKYDRIMKHVGQHPEIPRFEKCFRDKAKESR